VIYFATIIALYRLKYRLVSAVIFSFDVCVLCQVAEWMKSTAVNYDLKLRLKTSLCLFIGLVRNDNELKV
jgi:hypothetical protein